MFAWAASTVALPEEGRSSINLLKSHIPWFNGLANVVEALGVLSLFLS